MKPVKLFAVFLLTLSVLAAAEAPFYFLKTKGDYAALNSAIVATFKAADYKIGENRDMVGPFKKQFGNSYFERYNLINVHSKKHVSTLSAIDANIGAFAPFTIATYEKDGFFYAGFLKPKTMGEILGMKGGAKELAAYEKENIALLNKALPGAQVHDPAYKPKNSGKPYLVRYDYDTEGEDPAGLKDDLEMMLEGEFDVNGFVIANYNNLHDQLTNKAGFDLYSTYSICKLSVFYVVTKTRPEAGVFGPCTFAVYQLKGDNKAIMIYPSVYNWIDHLSIDDGEAIDQLLKAEALIEASLQKITE